jgi:FtsP/CotA-like multicopper oxidase with cupredoxin domain
VLEDRRLDAQNQLVYLESGINSMMTTMHGFLGDLLPVNGHERPSLALATRACRLPAQLSTFGASWQRVAAGPVRRTRSS